MLGRKRFYCALAFVTTVALGCGDSANTDTTGKGTTSGGSSSSSSSSSGGEGGGGGGGGAGGGLTCPKDEATVLAASELFFGEGTNGQWKAFGHNLDAKESTAASKDLCQPYMGTATSIPYPDGDNGIDNSFGKNLLPVILSLYPTWVQDINNGIAKGFFTSMLKMECLPPKGDVEKFTTKLFGGTPLPAAPKFDGTDKWPVAPELLSNSLDADSSTIIFDQCSVKGQAFDGGPNSTFVLTVPIKTMTDSTSIKLTLYAATLKMTLADDRKSASAGMLGGVLNTEEFLAEIKKVGSLLNLCGTGAFDNIVQKVREASDIMTDGTQDPNKPCDGISMGMGFDMKQVQLGDVGPIQPVGDSCK